MTGIEREGGLLVSLSNSGFHLVVDRRGITNLNAPSPPRFGSKWEV
jgi:hypothetical protein